MLEGNIKSIGQNAVLNQFMSIDAVEVFAQRLGFELIEVHRSDEPFIPMTDQLAGSNAATQLHGIGQSIAIYRKPPRTAG